MSDYSKIQALYKQGLIDEINATNKQINDEGRHTQRVDDLILHGNFISEMLSLFKMNGIVPMNEYIMLEKELTVNGQTVREYCYCINCEMITTMNRADHSCNRCGMRDISPIKNQSKIKKQIKETK